MPSDDQGPVESAEDAQLLARWRDAQDREAFDALFRRHHEPALRLAVRLGGSRADAEDVVQNAFIGVMQRAGQQQAGSSVRGWLMAAVVNGVRMRLREDSRRHRREEVAALRGDLVSDPADEGSDLAAIVVREVDRLPEPYRVALWLRFREGMSSRDIAQSLHLPQRTAREHVQRGLEKLRSALDRSGHVLSLGAVGAAVATAHAADPSASPAGTGPRVSPAMVSATMVATLALAVAGLVWGTVLRPVAPANREAAVSPDEPGPVFGDPLEVEVSLTLERVDLAEAVDALALSLPRDRRSRMAIAPGLVDQRVGIDLVFRGSARSACERIAREFGASWSELPGGLIGWHRDAALPADLAKLADVGAPAAERATAATALARSADRRALLALVATLGDAERELAERVLDLLQPAAFAPEVHWREPALAMLADEPSAVEAVGRALARLPPEQRLARVCGAMRAQSALSTLGAMLATDPPVASPPTGQEERDRRVLAQRLVAEGSARTTASWALGRLGERGVEVLLAYLAAAPAERLRLVAPGLIASGRGPGGTALLAALPGLSPLERTRMVGAVGSLGDPAAIPWLLTMSADAVVGRIAAGPVALQAVGRIDGPEAAAALLAMLREQRPAVDERNSFWLGLSNGLAALRDPAAILVLAPALDDPKTRPWVQAALIHLGHRPAQDQAIALLDLAATDGGVAELTPLLGPLALARRAAVGPRLIALLARDRPEAIRVLAARHLAATREPQARRIFGDLVRDPVGEVRAAALVGIAQLGIDAASRPGLHAGLADPSPEVRKAVASALCSSDDPADLGRILGALETDNDPDVRRQIALTLAFHHQGSASPGRPAVIAALERAQAAETDPGLRFQIANRLNALRGANEPAATSGDY